MRLQGDLPQIVAAGQTDLLIGPSGGKKGDVLRHIVVFPGATGALGNLVLKDGAVQYTIPLGSSADQQPFNVDFGSHGLRSRVGAWSVTTPATTSVMVVGDVS